MNEDFVTWDDVYSVGFEPIDIQHKELVKMTNELFKSCKQGAEAADEAYLRTIKKAVEYARNHFSEEEKYMVQADYPELNEHRKLHDEFMATILNAIHEFTLRNTAPIEMARYLKKWLLHHIGMVDKEYAPYLIKLTEIPG